VRRVKRLLPMLLLLVCAVPASAAAPRLLATEDAWPVWSPDGHTIAFTRVHQGRNLMELELVDTRTHRVTKVAQNLGQLQPSWSPDGTRVAYQAGGSVYVSDLHGATSRIGRGGAPSYGSTIARTQDGNLVVGTSTWARNVVGRPAWSPDGSQIAFRRDGGVYTIDRPGADRLLVGGPNPGDPIWSPEGSQVAFSLGDEIWVSGGGSTPAHAIARDRPDPSAPSWLPDGSAVVYTSRGTVTRTSLTGHSTVLHTHAGLGAGVSRTGVVAFSGARASCPGHLAIVTSAVLTGSCLVLGTAKTDVIEGTPLWGDVIQAGGGADQVHANDGYTDRVDCGPGRDTVWANRTDRLAHCEVIHR
jgi:Tol biopolymer transport system component